MDRRDFVQKTILTTAAISTITTAGLASNLSGDLNKPVYKLKFAPHEGMFKHHAGDDIIDQLQFMAHQGFKAFEDNEMRNRPIKTQEAIAALMQNNHMEMGVFVAHKIYWDVPNLASGDATYRNEFLNDIRNSVDVAKRVNAKWMTVVPGFVDLSKDEGYQTANVIETLKQAAAILETHGIIMVLEPLNFRDHPGMFLNKAAQAYKICKAVNSPSCKILFDIYHQQIQEGNLIPNIEACWDEIAYFQIGDNPGRNEPTTGEINYTNVFKYIHNKVFTGILGMEHGNSIPGKAGELAVIDAYKRTSRF